MRFYLLILFYLISLTGVVVYDLPIHLKVLGGSVITLILIVVLIVGVSVIKVNLFLKSLCFLKPAKNKVAITFDDGPDPVYTPQVLDLLAQYDAKASFFCIGSKIKGNEALLRRMDQEGHSIGNHTYEHASAFLFWSPKRMIASVLKTDQEITKVIHKEIKMFRPPFGVVNNLVAYMVTKLNKTSVGWSVRTKDTCRTPEQVVQIVKEGIKPGSIILLHDSHENIVNELKQILDYCQLHQLKPVAIEV